MNDIAKWIIVGFAVAGFIFNTGILYNDVKHLKASTKKLWEKVDEITKLLEYYK